MNGNNYINNNIQKHIMNNRTIQKQTQNNKKKVKETTKSTVKIIDNLKNSAIDLTEIKQANIIRTWGINNNKIQDNNYISNEELSKSNAYLENRYKNISKDKLFSLALEQFNNLNTSNKKVWEKHLEAINNGKISPKEFILMWLASKSIFSFEDTKISESNLSKFIPTNNEVLKGVNTDNILLSSLELNLVSKKANLSEEERKDINEVSKNLSITMGSITSKLVNYIKEKESIDNLDKINYKSLDVIQSAIYRDDKNHDFDKLGEVTFDAVKKANSLVDSNALTIKKDGKINNRGIVSTVLTSYVSSHAMSYVSSHAIKALVLAKGALISTLGFPSLCFIGGVGLAVGIGVTLFNKAKKLFFN